MRHPRQIHRIVGGAGAVGGLVHKLPAANEAAVRAQRAQQGGRAPLSRGRQVQPFLDSCPAAPSSLDVGEVEVLAAIVGGRVDHSGVLGQRIPRSSCRKGGKPRQRQRLNFVIAPGGDEGRPRKQRLREAGPRIPAAGGGRRGRRQSEHVS